MAEDYIDVQTSSEIPLLHSRKEVAVGFTDLGSIKPLDELLSAYFPKKYGEKLSKSLENNFRKVHDKIEKFLDLEDFDRKNRNRSYDRIIEISTQVKNAIDKSIEKHRAISTEGLRQLTTTLKAVGMEVGKQASEGIKRNFKDLGFLRDLETAGVELTDSFDSLRKVSRTLALRNEELTKWFTTSSATLQRLNANYGNGVDIFSNIMNNIKNQYTTSREEEMAVISEYLESRTRYANLERLTEQQLNAETSLYLKNLVALRNATGKSVEILMKENKIREDDFALQSLMDMNPAMRAIHDLLANSIGPELARAYMIGDVTNQQYLGSLSTSTGQGIQQIVQAVRAGRITDANRMIEQLNKVVAVNQPYRDALRAEMARNPLSSDLVYKNQPQAGAARTILGLQRMSTYNPNTQDNQDLQKVRAASDEYRRTQIMLQQAVTQNLHTAATEIGFFGDKLKSINDNVLTKIIELKEKFSDNAWADAFMSFGAAAAGGLALGLLKSAGTWTINAATVFVNGKLFGDGSGGYTGSGGSGNSKRGKASKLPKGGKGKAGILRRAASAIGNADDYLMNSKAGKVLGKVSTGLGVASLAKGGYDLIASDDKLGASKNFLQSALWFLGPGWGLAGELAGWVGEKAGEGVAWVVNALAGDYEFKGAHEKYLAMMREREKAGNPIVPKTGQPVPKINYTPQSQPTMGTKSNNVSQTTVTPQQQSKQIEKKDLNDTNMILNNLLTELQKIERGVAQGNKIMNSNPYPRNITAP